MDLARLNLFRDIAKFRSVTRGAQRNGISQSAASQHIQELERSLEVKLLDRSTRPFTLTPAGKIYYEFCRDVIRRKHELDSALKDVKSKVEGQIRIASIYSVGLSEASGWETDFRAQYPDTELSIEFLRPELVYEAVRSDAADIGLVSYPEPTRDVTVTPWRNEVMVVATRPDHPLTVSTFLAAEELNGMDFVGFDDDLPIARELQRYFREHGVEVNIVMRFDNVLMIKEAIALGTGISILPERVIADEIAQDRLVGIPLESPGLHRPLGIVHRKRKRFTPAERAFLALLDPRVAAAELR